MIWWRSFLLGVVCGMVIVMGLAFIGAAKDKKNRGERK